jgi:hypothetical protein
MGWGIAVSVVLHLLLIFGYRLSGHKAAPELPPRETMTVWLMQPRPQVPVAVKAESPEPVRPVQQPARKKLEVESKVAASRAAPALEATTKETPSQTITPAPIPVPATPPVNNAPDPLYPPQQQQQQQQQRSGQFDMNAALKTARKVANEKDPARAGLPVAQLDDHPLYPEQTSSELAKKVAGAKRQSCLNEGGGNLLTPLYWLLDKKDHGCKL